MKRNMLRIAARTSNCTAVCFLLIISVAALPASAHGQRGPIGPGSGAVDGGLIVGQFAEWSRKATPMLVLRVHGAAMLQTFAEISPAGAFKLSLPDVPSAGNFGSLTCGGQANGLIVVASDVSLLTTLSGFSSPGRYDRGMSEIGMALLADDTFANAIGKPGGKRAMWLHSQVARSVAVGECNNVNSFSLNKGWNTLTVVSGPDGGPHSFAAGLDPTLGWYWYAFSEDSTTRVPPIPPSTSSGAAANLPAIDTKWLLGEWDGLQVDVVMFMRLDSTGSVWLESTEGGRKKTIEGKWSITGAEFVLSIPEGELHFYIERLSETRFRFFGKDASSDIVFTRKRES